MALFHVVIQGPRLFVGCALLYLIRGSQSYHTHCYDLQREKNMEHCPWEVFPCWAEFHLLEFHWLKLSHMTHLGEVPSRRRS